MAEETRRDFIVLATGAMAAVGGGAAAFGALSTIQPGKDTLAAGKTKVDVSNIAPGDGIKVLFQKQPAFVRRRTAEEIAQAKADDSADMRDPQTDAERTVNGLNNAPGSAEEWLIVKGACTHLGCVPTGTAVGEVNQRGEFGGWFCPCHGSHYDTSGRIRKGPAPLNLFVPDYHFDEAGILIIGELAA